MLLYKDIKEAVWRGPGGKELRTPVNSHMSSLGLTAGVANILNLHERLRARTSQATLDFSTL
jgi:hypothetical protein